jgi:hypothetical protein
MKSIDSTKRDYQRMKVMSEFREQESLNLRLKIPKAHYELWQGIKAAHGLNEDFLEFVVSRMVMQTIFTFMQMTEDFAE